MPPFIDHILARTAMYCGKRFETIDEFALFFNGLSLGLSLKDVMPSEERQLLNGFGEFMRHHLHGENKNCHWQYDLLGRVGSQADAVASAAALLCFLRARTSVEGGEKLEVLIKQAHRIYASRLPGGQYEVVDGRIGKKKPNRSPKSRSKRKK